MFPRLIEKNINNNLNNNKIIILTGARQVGKTTILKKIKSKLQKNNKEVFFINLERLQYLDLLNQDPENIFQIIGTTKKKKYIIIDEVQYLKNPTNFLKYLYDEYQKKLKLIVSGSSAFYIDKKFHDSLAGRKILLEIYSLNFKEFLIFKKQAELTKYCHKKNIPLILKKNILNYYYEFITYGGYPEVVLTNNFKQKKELLDELINSYIKKDIKESNINHPEKYLFILKILASQIGNLLNKHELANTIDLPAGTVDNYIYIMQKSFHIATIKPFFSNIRKELTKTPKIYFFDLGLRNYLLNNFEEFNYRIDKGNLLENLVFNNLVSNYTKDNIKFWRTQNKNEIDFIVNDTEAYEVKTNLKLINEKKYSLFKKEYSNIPLDYIDLEKSLRIL